MRQTTDFEKYLVVNGNTSTPNDTENSSKIALADKPNQENKNECNLQAATHHC